MTHEEYHRLAKSVLEQADCMKPLWEGLAKRIMPRVEDAINQFEAIYANKRDACSVASESMHTLAAAHYSYITPAGMQWFKFKSAKRDEQTGVGKEWYANAGEVALQELSKSNFYAEVQEAYLSRVLFGTALLLCETKSGGGLLFRNVPVGTFGIAENFEGVIDTVCRRFEYTAAQAVARWGEKVPAVVSQAYERPERRFRDKFTFLHLVTPRSSYARGNGQKFVSPRDMRFASVYLFEGSEHQVLEEGGYEEFPYLATRFLKWPGSVWGYPPALQCMSSIVSLMKLENNLDALSDLAVFPRILTSPDEVGEVDFRAGGQTVISEMAASMNLPREWGTSGRISEAKERAEMKRQDIKSAFYVPFLNVISSVDRTMTATEVQARQEEQALSFSPTFTQLTSELTVLLYRIFAVCFRQGLFNTPKYMLPPSLKQNVTTHKDGTEDFSVSVPQVHYMGRISQALEKSQRIGIEGVLQLAQEFVHATGDTSPLDYLDTGKMLVQAVETTGAPVDAIRSEDEVQKIRTQRENMQMMQLQAEIAAQGAGAYKDLSSAA